MPVICAVAALACARTAHRRRTRDARSSPTCASRAPSSRTPTWSCSSIRQRSVAPRRDENRAGLARWPAARRATPRSSSASSAMVRPAACGCTSTSSTRASTTGPRRSPELMAVAREDRSVYRCTDCGAEHPQAGPAAATPAASGTRWSRSRRAGERSGARARAAKPAIERVRRGGARRDSRRVRPAREAHALAYRASPSSTSCSAAASCRARWCSWAASRASASARCCCRWRRASRPPGSATLYVSGEESPLQVKLRADRLGEPAGGVSLVGETSLETILATAADRTTRRRPCSWWTPSRPCSPTTSRGRPATWDRCASAPPGSCASPRSRGVGRVRRRSRDQGRRHRRPQDARAHRRHRALLRGRGHRSITACCAPRRTASARVDEIGVFRMTEQGLAAGGEPVGALPRRPRTTVSSGSAVTALHGGHAAGAGGGAGARGARPASARRSAWPPAIDGRRLALLLAVLDKRGGLLLRAARRLPATSSAACACRSRPGPRRRRGAREQRLRPGAARRTPSSSAKSGSAVKSAPSRRSSAGSPKRPSSA